MLVKDPIKPCNSHQRLASLLSFAFTPQPTNPTINWLHREKNLTNLAGSSPCSISVQQIEEHGHVLHRTRKHRVETKRAPTGWENGFDRDVRTPDVCRVVEPASSILFYPTSSSMQLAWPNTWTIFVLFLLALTHVSRNHSFILRI